MEHMNNKIFIPLVAVAAIVLAGWFFWKSHVAPASSSQTIVATPTPAGSNLPPARSFGSVPPNGLEKGGVPESAIPVTR